MLRNLFVTLFIIVSSVAVNAKTYKYESVSGDPMATRIYTLDNGLKVYMSVNKVAPRITAHIAVNTGSSNDPAETTGLAHYLEHLMFKGSKRFGTTDYAKEEPLLKKISDLYEEYRTLTDPAERKAKYQEIDSVSQLAAKYNIPNEYDKMMSAIGSIGTNAYTSFDVTCYVEDIPSNELERWCILQSDRFQNLVMRGFHTELESVYEEKNISMTKDSRKSIEALMRLLFPTHPYGTQTTIGTQEHLKNPSQVNIRNYFNKYYVPNNVAICLAGDLNPDEAIKTIDRHFASWKPGKDITRRTFKPLPPLTSPKDTTVLGHETEHVILGWRLKEASSLQNDTITMVDMLLSNGDVGLIDIDLNQKMKLIGGASGIWELKDHSLFMFQGSPKEGQTLEEVRALLIEELEKIKRGEWDEKLIHSIYLNNKLSMLRALDNNKQRVSTMVDSYINEVPWKQKIEAIERMGKLTKQDIVQWVNQNLGEGYVCVYKRKGEDTTIVKIDKPAITPIPSNRDLKSQFLTDFLGKDVEPIQPQFVDFEKELTIGTTKKGLPVIYKQNTDDERFTLVYQYDFGTEADQRLSHISDLSTLFGTKKESAEEIKRKFYDIACTYTIGVSGKKVSISLSGLQENMPKAVKMLEEFISDMQADTAVYKQYVEQVLKMRMERRTNQTNCYNALVAYGLYGKQNPMTDVSSPEELKKTAPETYVKLLQGLKDMKHRVLYWGPATMKEVSAIVTKAHKTKKTLAEVPANKPYTVQPISETEVYIAPYKAKNINMRMLTSAGKEFKIERKPIVNLFNEYFGGSMNAIVFQELREARGLAYNAWAQYISPSRKSETEYYMQHIISQNDKMIDCIKVFKEITDTLPQSQNLFNTAKNSIIKTLTAQRTTKMGVINKYLSAKEMGIDYDINKLYLDVVPTLTLTDLVEFEQENIKGKPMKYLIVGEENELDMKELQKLGTVHKLSLNDIFPAYE